MNTFSFSRLNLYQTCPRRFYYKYVLELDDPPGEAAILGKTVHKAIELVLNGRSFDDAVLTACMEEAELMLDKQEIERMVQTAMNTLPMFPGKPTGIEQYFIETLTERAEIPTGMVMPETRVQGYMDLVYKNTASPIIVDWKTNRRPYPVNQTWQIPLYASIIMEQEKTDTVEGVLVFLRTGQVFRQTITRDIADLAKNWAANLAWEINLKLHHKTNPLIAFDSSPSAACGHCPWSYQCLLDDETKKIREVVL
jgi:CRISPR/Cas system-associated exonuclease Cas4 (RecB family)